MSDAMMLVTENDGRLNFYVNPYYYKSGVYFGEPITSHSAQEVVPIYGDDIYVFDGNLQGLLRAIRSGFNREGETVTLHNIADNARVRKMHTIFGYCTATFANDKTGSAMFIFDKGVSGMESELSVVFDSECVAFKVSTPRRKSDKLTNAKCEGGAYKEIRAVLQEFPNGLTAAEISALIPRQSAPNTVSSRLNEMNKVGETVKCGKKVSKMGIYVSIWKLKD